MFTLVEMRTGGEAELPLGALAVFPLTQSPAALPIITKCLREVDLTRNQCQRTEAAKYFPHAAMSLECGQKQNSTGQISETNLSQNGYG